MDNLRLNDKSSFDFELIESEHPCDPDFAFAVAENPIFSYQWYKKGIALIGESDAELSQMYGEGAYQLRIINENTQKCRLADDFEYIIPAFRHEVFETICEGGNLMYEGDLIEDAGMYEYILNSVDGCDSIVRLNVEKEQHITNTVYVRILPGTTYSMDDAHFTNEGEYDINLVTSNGCDSTIVLNLEKIKVFIPNIFSPSGDGINDYFEVFTSDDEFVTKEMSIFDRWGDLLYFGEKWDGELDNKFVNEGVYVYLVRLTDIAGEELILSNSITLTR